MSWDAFFEKINSRGDVCSAMESMLLFSPSSSFLFSYSPFCVLSFSYTLHCLFHVCTFPVLVEMHFIVKSIFIFLLNIPMKLSLTIFLIWESSYWEVLVFHSVQSLALSSPQAIWCYVISVITLEYILHITLWRHKIKSLIINTHLLPWDPLASISRHTYGTFFFLSCCVLFL